jgi:prevent-host-death family protein
MGRKWQIQEAKNRFCEVVEEAANYGPQHITRRGVDTAVIMSYNDYKKLLIDREPMSQFFRNSPLVGVDLALDRDKSSIRITDIL